MIRLRFLSEPTLSSLIVQGFTWSPWSHVEMVLPDGYLGARFDGGVQLRKFNYTKTSREAFAHIDCDDQTTAKILAYARSQIGMPYDWLGILGIAVHQDWFNPKARICSRFVFEACKRYGVVLLDESHANRVSPGALAESPLVIFDKV